MKKVLSLFLILFVILVSCTKENIQEGLAVLDEEEGDRLELDPQLFPFNTLSSYRFFKGQLALQRPVGSLHNLNGHVRQAPGSTQ